MRSNRPIFITALLTLALLFVAGCGMIGGGDGGGGAAAGPDMGDWTRTAWRQPFPETVTVTIAEDEMAHAVFPEGYDIFNTLWAERWLEEFNVEVVVDWVSADYELQTNLVIAAGNLPDMIWLTPVQFQQALDANLVEDITDEIAAWSSPGLARLLASEQNVFDTAHRDGRAFSIPRLHYGFITQTPYFWVRKDLYEQAGSPPINTVADFENLALYFQQNLDVPFPIVMDDGLHTFFNGIPMFNGHSAGRTRQWFTGPDGTILSSYESPGFAEAIRYFARWYEMGLMHPEFATIDWDMMSGEIVSGNSVMEFGANWRGWPWQNVVTNFTEDSYLIVLPMPTPDGSRAQIPIFFANYGHNVVRRGYEFPEILPILLSDYVYMLNEASLAGNLPVEYIEPFTINEMHHTTGPFWIAFPHYDDVVAVLNALDDHAAGNEPTFTSSYQVLYFNEIIRWVDHRELDGMGRFAQMGNRRSSLAMGVYYEDNNMFLQCRAWGPMPQEVLDLGGITDSIIEEGVVRLIMGLDPIEHWEVVLEDWRQAGGNTMTAAINEMYGN